ncbi:MAG: HAD-IC family P-type ATPase, partial [Clostridiales bacterium]|nr:HAD-IC family P-type ATPase [Clostridiales bacterium]
MIAHGSTPEDIAGQYQSDLRAGLTSQRAAELRRQHGENRLTSRPPRSLAARFFDQFRDVMIWILLAAAAISFAVAIAERNAGELVEPALILAIVIANAAMGVAQESRAEKALEALKQLSAPHARVVRDGAEQSIDAAELVPGDLILLEAGDYAPADGRLIESASLRADESALTGESVPAEKDARAAVPDDAPLGDRRNMVHSGCPIAYGRGRAIVTATGMATEMGRIAGLLEQSGEEATPLQKKLAQLGKYLGLAAVAACAVIFAVGLLNGIPILEIFMVSVSLAVSAIPEGLPAIVTVVLALGVQRMVRRNAIIRRLTAVETLGGASVICSDKTGTLTQNRMTLVRAYVDGVGPEDISDHNGEGVRRLLTLAALCSDASIALDGDQVRLLGDPTETSIVMAARQNGIDKADLAARHPRLAELPFDSGRKRMTTVHRLDGKLVAVVKGAFDVLAARCTSGDLDAARQANDQMGGHALRVLAVAVRHLDAVPTDPQPDDVERDLTLVGLVGMIDPPRPEAGRAVEVCRRAGIKPVMITGDHVATARAIAGQLDILREGDAAITGAQLAGMSDEQLDRDVRGISVYARVSPEDKIRIVRAWQRAGEVVAMTG